MDKIHRISFDVAQGARNECTNSVLCPCQPVVIVEPDNNRIIYVHQPEHFRFDVRVGRILEERKNGLVAGNQ